MYKNPLKSLNLNKYLPMCIYTYIILVDIVNMKNWPNSMCERIWWLITWPINFVLLITIPDCRRSTLKSWYPLTFIMCIIWIATTSYIVGWVITVIGTYLCNNCCYRSQISKCTRFILDIDLK